MDRRDLSDSRRILRALFDTAVVAADPMRCIPRVLPPRPTGKVVVIGVGKASARMAEAVEGVWGPCEGLVITRDGYARDLCGIEVVEAAHPVPDARAASLLPGGCSLFCNPVAKATSSLL